MHQNIQTPLLLGRDLGGADAAKVVYSTDELQRLLRRERLRSDRFDSVFSLLTLTFPTPCDNTELATIERVLSDRLRATDEVGYLSPGCIGIILPGTLPEGAWTLADDVCRLLPSEVRPPECEVYMYPPPTKPRECNGDLSARHDNTAGLAFTNGRMNNGAAAHERSAVEADGNALSMTELLLQPLPVWKRAIDILGAGLALLLAAPLMLLTVAIMKVSSRGPVLYKQLRDGHGGRKFWIYKFRTMVIDAEAMQSQLRSMSQQDGPAFKLKDDPRVTTFGRLLRRTCVDELPQLFNVLKGDMSLVGPRPMCSKEASHCSQWQRRRLDVTPGLTCTWQVYGGADTPFTEWMRMDLRYVRSRSLWRDLRLMVMTIPSIIRRDGVY